MNSNYKIYTLFLSLLLIVGNLDANAQSSSSVLLPDGTLKKVIRNRSDFEVPGMPPLKKCISPDPSYDCEGKPHFKTAYDTNPNLSQDQTTKQKLAPSWRNDPRRDYYIPIPKKNLERISADSSSNSKFNVTPAIPSIIENFYDETPTFDNFETECWSDLELNGQLVDFCQSLLDFMAKDVRNGLVKNLDAEYSSTFRASHCHFEIAVTTRHGMIQGAENLDGDDLSFVFSLPDTTDDVLDGKTLPLKDALLFANQKCDSDLILQNPHLRSTLDLSENPKTQYNNAPPFLGYLFRLQTH